MQLIKNELEIISNLLDLDIQAMNSLGDEDTAEQLKIITKLSNKIDEMIKQCK